MTDKVQKIKDWISKTQDGLMDAQGNFEYPEHEGAYHILCNLNAYIDSLQEEPKFKIGDIIRFKGNETLEGEEETHKIVGYDNELYIFDDGTTDLFCEQELYELVKEPVSDGLQKASEEWLVKQLDKSYTKYGERKMMELSHFDGYSMLDAIEFGVQWQKEHLWKPADGNDLPDIDREVIVLYQPYPLENSEYAVIFAHRPPEYWDGRNMATGEVTRYYPERYDKGGWNIPDVKFWLDCELPKTMEE